MLLFSLLLLGVGVLILLCLLTHQNRKIRGSAGAALSILSVVTFGVFLYAYYISGGPDAGQEWMQIFFPGLVFMGLFTVGILGIVSAFWSIKLYKEV